MLVDTIYVDEFQDFKGADYELLMLLMKSKKIDVVSVGDFYQHSVAMSAERRGLPFKKGKRYLSEEEFLDVLPKSVKLDEQSLICSRRVPQKICDFIKKKLSYSKRSILFKKKATKKKKENFKEQKMINLSESTKLLKH